MYKNIGNICRFFIFPKRIEGLPSLTEISPKHTEGRPEHMETSPEHVEGLPAPTETSPKYTEASPEGDVFALLLRGYNSYSID